MDMPPARKPTFEVVDRRDGNAYPQLAMGHTPDEALQIAQQARAAFEDWRRTDIAERAALMRRAGAVLRDRTAELCALMTEEMGKTLTEGRAEIEKCAGHCDFYAEHAAAFLAERPIDMGGPKAKVAFRPLGTILAVMPWNFPFWQVFRFAAPALMAGNTGLLKHASNVPGCALAIEDVFREAGFPADVFRTLLIPSGAVRAVIEDDADRRGVGQPDRQCRGRSAGGLRKAGGVLKKCVLELGGSDAYVVLEDADIEAAAQVAATARMVNAGQSCIAGKRFIVVAEIRPAFEQALAKAMEAFAMDDPRRRPRMKLGPLESVAARDHVHQQVEGSVAKGARVLVGGAVPDRPGAWYPATVLSDVRAGMPAHDEEVFGPVAAVIEAKDEADAIRIANDSPFGLGSGVLTADLVRGERIATEELEAGMSFVNQNVRSDSRLPFGGVKHSGYGRECGEFGIHEFVNIKTVLVHDEPKPKGGSE